MSDEEKNVERSPDGTSDTKLFTWQIPHFNELPLDLDFCVGSDKFIFDGIGWCIRTYPNGKSENKSDGWICLMLRKTTFCTPSRQILCKFGVRHNDGWETIMTEDIFKRNDLELGPIKLLPLSEACKPENIFLQNGVITMVCRMEFIEITGREATASSETPINMHDERQIIGHVFQETICVRVYTWPLPPFKSMPMEVNYCVASPPFQFEGAKCSLRLYPNGCSATETQGWICVKLMMPRRWITRLQSQIAKCEIGIRNDQHKECGVFDLVMYKEVLGPFALILRSHVNNYFPDDTLKVFCKVLTGKRTETERPISPLGASF